MNIELLKIEKQDQSLLTEKLAEDDLFINNEDKFTLAQKQRFSD